MAVTDRQLADLLVSTIADKSDAKQMNAVHDFASLLKEKGLLGRLRGIERELAGSWKRQFGASQITVVAAHPLTKELREAITKKAPGADLIERVDERLIGGAVLRIDDQRIDGSIAGSLRRLKNSLS